jgi:uncharacterized protein (TIGR02001 family)
MSVRGVLAAALLCGAGTLGTSSAGEWDASLILTSDYVFRGQSQSRGDPVMQGDLHWRSAAEWFAGAWGSMVDLHAGPGPTSELNLYAGRGWRVGNHWHAKLVAVGYLYPKQSPQLTWDYEEVLGSLAFRDLLIASVAWSPNTSRFSRMGMAENREAVSYELTSHVPWRTAWTFSGGIGYYDLDQLFGTGYTYWSCGLNYSAAPWQLMLARIGTSGEAAALFGRETTDDRWSLSVRRQLGPRTP